jgi:hypothetical protein
MSGAAATDAADGPRRLLTLEQAYARSAKIRLWRMAFLIAAIVPAVTLAVVIGLRMAAPAPTAADDLASDAGQRIVAPRFEGRTTSGDGYVISAKTASRPNAAVQSLSLEAPRYETTAGIVVTAARGALNLETGAVVLDGGVTWNDPRSQSRMTTERAQVAPEIASISALAPVEVVWPLGVATAAAYEIDPDGQRVRLSGGVRVVINGGGAEETP